MKSRLAYLVFCGSAWLQCAFIGRKEEIIIEENSKFQYCHFLKKVVVLPGYMLIQEELFRCSGSICCPSLISRFLRGNKLLGLLLCYYMCIIWSWFENYWAAVGAWLVLYRLVCCVMVVTVTECSRCILKSWANIPGDWCLLANTDRHGLWCQKPLRQSVPRRPPMSRLYFTQQTGCCVF